MACELAFALINPYTIAKSRTGGVMARFIGRTDLHFVGARMFGPSAALAREYSELVRHADPANWDTNGLIADYIARSYAPDPKTGRSRRVLLLLFEGEDAVGKIWRVTGHVKMQWGSGETIRDTYGDYIVNDQGVVQYFEPAVLVAPNSQRAGATLRLWSRYSSADGGILDSGADVPAGSDIGRTLVLLKPDNFRYPSLRAGYIIDILSRSGLRIVGAKKLCMTVAQAEEFYAPVRDSLARKFADFGPPRAAIALEREFGLPVREETVKAVCGELAPRFAETQFEEIVHFMTGFKPSECFGEDKAKCGKEECLALVYEGRDAVNKIRAIIGTTDPNRASPGSVRREFGRDIMVNSIHASDSVESAEREMRIIRVEEDTVTPWVQKYYPGN